MKIITITLQLDGCRKYWVCREVAIMPFLEATRVREPKRILFYGAVLKLPMNQAGIPAEETL